MALLWRCYDVAMVKLPWVVVMVTGGAPLEGGVFGPQSAYYNLLNSCEKEDVKR